MSTVLFGTQQVHDYHSALGFPVYTESLKALRASTPRTVLTWVTRSNMRALDHLLPVLVREKVERWSLAPVPTAGEIDAVAPRLALAAPRVLHALTRAERQGIEVSLLAWPLCLLGPYATRARRTEAQSFGSACETCAARSACPGVSTVYRDRFEGDEFRARDAVSIDVSEGPTWRAEPT
ncbi:MAG: hypothetical protein AAGE52_00860 [Myxococcota bacterium]